MRFSRHLQCLIPHLLCDCPSYNCAATCVSRCPCCFILSTFFCIIHPMCDRFTKDTFRLYATEDARREQFGSRGEMRQYKSPVQCTGVTRAGRRCGITSETSRLLDDRGNNVNEPLLLGARHCRFHLQLFCTKPADNVDCLLFYLDFETSGLDVIVPSARSPRRAIFRSSWRTRRLLSSSLRALKKRTCGSWSSDIGGYRRSNKPCST